MITGRQIADKMQADLKQKIDKLPTKPKLATFLIGNSPASAMYVRMKNRACKNVGILTKTYHLPDNCSAGLLVEQMDKLNHDDSVNGILIEKPYRIKGSTEEAVNDWIQPEKDVDGTNTLNYGKLAKFGYLPNLYNHANAMEPCTAKGIFALIKANLHDISLFNGKRIAIINRSEIVGVPLVLMLIHAGAEVSVFNHHMSRYSLANGGDYDIIVAATGQPDIVTSDTVNERQWLIPVSENKGKDGKIHGDFTPKACQRACYAFTPTGNVGPVCIAYLLSNVYHAYLNQKQR